MHACTCACGHGANWHSAGRSKSSVKQGIQLTPLRTRTHASAAFTRAAQASELAGRLAAAVAEAEGINAQERMFGWPATKYGHVAKLAAAVEPYAGLWGTINGFYNSYAGWMGCPFWRLSPEAVEAEAADAAR